jgi:hypothetical protein
MNDQSRTTPGAPDQDDEPLAGVAGDDVSAGISGSGVGGQEIGGADGDETGLDEVVEEGTRTGWGRAGRPDEG